MVANAPPGARVMDLRSPSAFEEFHLPQARPLTPKALLAMLSARDRPDQIVLYRPGDGSAGRLARAARPARCDGVPYWTGGVQQWSTEVMEPALRLGATEEERIDFERVAALSRYFGGRPRHDVPDNDDGAAVPWARPRRGCGIDITHFRC